MLLVMNPGSSSVRCCCFRRVNIGLVVLLVALFLSLSVEGSNSSNEGMVCSSGEQEGGVCSSSNTNDHQQEQRKQLEELDLEMTPTAEEAALCIDEHDSCEFWATAGECDANPVYMHQSCRKSCNTCPKSTKGDPNVLLHRNQWGVSQEILQGVAMKSNDMSIPNYDYQKVYEWLQETQYYMKNKVYVEEKYENVRESCQNQHKSCTFWASLGECNRNKQYMEKSCAPACQTCETLDYYNRCPIDDAETLKTKNVWKEPGDLDQMFMDILNDPYYQQYTPVIYSKPKYIDITTVIDDDNTQSLRVTSTKEKKEDDDASVMFTADEDDDDDEDEIDDDDTPQQPIMNQLGVPIIQDGPWVVTLENFLTEKECDTLVNLGADQGYKRSSDVGKKKLDGTYDADINPGRTSTNAWCLDACYNDDITQQVIARMSNVTGIPDTNAEYIQLLRYEETQFYQQHHDYIQYQVKRQEGVRILTLFMYLNDVDAGGGTRFPLLDLTVMPKKGKALLWPSVLNEDPSGKDGRTDHEALPVEEGIKYGANAWFHLRDFKEAYGRGCTS